jgi:hypothetical protein
MKYLVNAGVESQRRAGTPYSYKATQQWCRKQGCTTPLKIPGCHRWQTCSTWSSRKARRSTIFFKESGTAVKWLKAKYQLCLTVTLTLSHLSEITGITAYIELDILHDDDFLQSLRFFWAEEGQDPLDAALNGFDPWSVAKAGCTIPLSAKFLRVDFSIQCPI